jgi:microcystin-dependent protein
LYKNKLSNNLHMEGMIGEIRLFGGTFAPRTWAFCDGQLMSIAQNTALFSILGTTYGGDGRTTFGLPDLRGRTAIGQGTGPGLSPRNLGEKSGVPTTTLTQASMPSHNHLVANVETSLQLGAGAAGTTTGAGNSLAAASSSNIYATVDPNPAAQLKAGSVSTNVTVGNTGSGTPFDNMNPYLTLRYVICLQGIFPSRN